MSWVDLLDIAETDRVLLLGSRSAAEADLRTHTPHVVVAERAQPPEAGQHDMVCVDGVRLTGRQRRRLASVLAPGGRWVQVSDNAVSPLRALDRLRGVRGGSDLRVSLGLLRRVLRRQVGVETHQAFALLRSSARPITAFDVLSRTGMAHTAAASLTHVRGVRGALLRLARRSPPRLVAWFAPGWMVVARAPEVPVDPRRVVGKVATNKSDEVKILRGDPPVEMEKRFVRSTPTAETAALRELGRLGFPLAPRLLEADETSLRYEWLTGETLRLARLDDEELTAWITRAADVLGELQRATRHVDGTVLVHGDFWLGNLLVDGERVCGILDWTRSHRGSPEFDRRFLVESLEGKRETSPELRARLVRIVDERLA